MKRLMLVTVMATIALIGPLAVAASAQTDIADVASALDEVWVVVAGMLVMFMQAGFALVESGFTRAKSAANIIMKNFMDFAVGALAYWAVGFGLAYGGSSVGGFLATGNWFFSDRARASEWFFQVVFAATAATIVSGAVAERVKFTAYSCTRHSSPPSSTRSCPTGYGRVTAGSPSGGSWTSPVQESYT